MKKFIGTIKTIAVCGAVVALPFAVMATEDNKKKQNNTSIEKNKPVIEIVSFSGKIGSNNNVDLFCKVKSNCCYNIIVERSKNGKNFSNIGTFSDNKNLAEYFLSDESPWKHTNFYRLKIIDNKGSVSYSKVMVVQLYNTEALSMVSVTPNTRLQDLHINVQLKNRAYVVMTITDENGKEILEKREAGKLGLNTFEMIGTGTMQPGNYSLEVRVNNTDRLLLPLIKD